MKTTMEHCRAVAGMLMGLAAAIIEEDAVPLRPIAFLLKDGMPAGLMTVDNGAIDRVRQLAHDHKVDAVITLSKMLLKLSVVKSKDDAMQRLAQAEKEDLANDPEARAGVVVAIKGPEVGSLLLVAPYVRNDEGDVEFLAPLTLPMDAPETTTIIGVPMIPDWWNEHDTFKPKPKITEGLN